jgi:hypothetical protein
MDGRVLTGLTTQAARAIKLNEYETATLYRAAWCRTSAARQ